MKVVNWASGRVCEVSRTGVVMKRFLFLIVVVIAVGAGYLYLNSGEVARRFIENKGSEATGVSVTIKAVELDILNGEATIRGLRIGNPEGFSDRAALSVDVVSVMLDANTVRKDVMTITRIYVQNPVLTYESVDGTSNFDVIRQNAESGGSGSAADSEDVQKFIVRLVEFTSGRINAVGLSPTGEELNAVMPGFKLRNIGKAEGGVPADVIASRIAVAVTAAVIEAVIAGALFDIVGDTIGGVTDIIPGFGGRDD